MDAKSTPPANRKTPTTANWPRYQCHKIVRAAKILTLSKDNKTNLWCAELEGLPDCELSDAFIQKHHPAIRGWLVEYEDGYRSYSPAKAFEEGYKLIDGEKENDSQDSGASTSGSD